MKAFLNTSLAAAIGAAAISPALADESPIVVQSSAAMDEWQADVTRSLDRRLVSAERQTRLTPETGIVQLRFTLDGYGKPQDIEVTSSSGSRATDFIARRAVSGLSDLDRAPVTNAASQTFQANVIFADDEASYAKLASKLEASERVRMARAASESDVVSFGL